MDTNLTLCADTEQGKEVASIDVARLLREAVEGVGCPHQLAADAVGYGESYWNRVLGNERGIVLERLGRLPVNVQRAFVAAWGEALGMAPAPGIESLAGLAELIATRRLKITIEHR
jgi:hypothetical protein